jgi:CelD/BcsL family acetyltransferase involved in cellulose biosynthesis
MYKVVVVRAEAGLLALEESWTALLAAANTATVFASYQWAVAWWQHFGAGNRLHVLAVYEPEGRLVGVAPLMIRPLGPFRKLEFIGTGLSDLGDVVIHPAHTAPVTAVLFQHLRARRGDWDLGDWSEIPPASPLLTYLAAHQPPGLAIRQVPQTECPVIDLPATWEAYVSGLARKRRYYVNSFPRKFEREHAGHFTTISRPAEVPAGVDTFYRLHMARWQVKAGELSAEHTDPHFRPFLEEVSTRLAERGWLRLTLLQAGEQPIAAAINFLFNGRWNSYMKGFDPAWSQARPGTLLDAARIKQAIAEHAAVLDFGRGDEAYKSGFGVTTYRTTRLLLGNTAPRSRAAYGLLALRRRLRQLRPPAASSAPPPDDDAPDPTNAPDPQHVAA